MVILAAGNSSRMGSIKQLLPWRNTTLLGNAIRQGLDSKVVDVVVVLGANAKIIIPTIKELDVKIIVNKHWKNGIGNSIAYSIGEIEKIFKHINGVLITLADTPFIETDYFNKMIKHFNIGEKNIVATKSKKKATVPALFGSKYFDKLGDLDKDVGAKKLLEKNSNDIFLIDAHTILFDIDTKEEYRLLIKKHSL